MHRRSGQGPVSCCSPSRPSPPVTRCVGGASGCPPAELPTRGCGCKGMHRRSGQDWQAELRVETQTTEFPSNAVQAESFSVFLGARCLLKSTKVTFPEQDGRSVEGHTASGKLTTSRRGACYGLAGPSGCGKSTLLRLIADGRIPSPAAWRPRLFGGQPLPPALARGVLDEVLSAEWRREKLVGQQLRLEERLASACFGAGSASDGAREAGRRLEEIRAQLGRWRRAPDEVSRMLLALGFSRSANVDGSGADTPSLDSSMQHLSAGWRMKVELAKALWLKPKLLLLDEPTNHLDFEARTWLAEQLGHYPHTVAVASHDVGFLQDMCQEVFLIQDCRLEPMPRDVVSQEDLGRVQRTKPLSFRFAVASDGSPESHWVSVRQLEFSFPSAARVPHLVLDLPGQVRFSGRSRAAVLGKNGSGKSTFLDLCAGRLWPSRGTVDHSDGCRIGYYSQQLNELDGYDELTAVEYLVQAHADDLLGRLETGARVPERASERRGTAKVLSATVQRRLAVVARGVLSNFGLEDDLAVRVPVGRLSGGQKARLKLAALSVQPAHIFFLDEPTTHLDAEACEALARGLSEFKGGIVVATRDDLLIHRLFQGSGALGELLTCHAGGVQCSEAIGGLCLKSLKQQLRQSEAEGFVDSGLRTPPPAQRAKPAKQDRSGGLSALPPWLAGSRSRGALQAVGAAESEVAPCNAVKAPQTGSSPATAAALPPWLASHRSKEEARGTAAAARQPQALAPRGAPSPGDEVQFGTKDGLREGPLVASQGALPPWLAPTCRQVQFGTKDGLREGPLVASQGALPPWLAPTRRQVERALAAPPHAPDRWDEDTDVPDRWDEGLDELSES
mmetsp:Transcript_52152/g.167818  ORF Transcript_52152/g.167818 Transcript_52152/m.167818 type:complete len:846 (-) Transcript_52152:101-2638(-)